MDRAAGYMDFVYGDVQSLYIGFYISSLYHSSPPKISVVSFVSVSGCFSGSCLIMGLELRIYEPESKRGDMCGRRVRPLLGKYWSEDLLHFLEMAL